MVAAEALARLGEGAAVADVELPVVTSWGRWSRIRGEDTRRRLVDAALGGGLHGRGGVLGAGVVDRLRRTLTGEGQPVVAIVDALDEARADSRLGGLAQLTGLGCGWRVIITSRPSAWGDASGYLRTGGFRVVGLQNVSYPEDVHSFIRAWFSGGGRSGRAGDLIEQIDERPDLRRRAVVPWWLSVFCLVGDAGGRVRLPWGRGELCRQVVRRLLREGLGESAGGEREITACESELRRYAWAAVRDQVTAAGLGAWRDTFTSPPVTRGLSERQRGAIDRLVPLVHGGGQGGDGDGGLAGGCHWCGRCGGVSAVRASPAAGALGG
jgi:hypothetical protein